MNYYKNNSLPPNWDELLPILEMARKSGYSDSSNIELLLQGLIDLSWVVSKRLAEGGPARRINPSIKFINSTMVDRTFDPEKNHWYGDFESRRDALGNPKQITIRKNRQFIISPELSELLKIYSETLVLFSQSFNSKKVIMTFWKKLGESFPEFNQTLEKKEKKVDPKKVQSQVFYHVRQLRKRSKHSSSSNKG
jgi:hypothetical protein